MGIWKLILSGGITLWVLVVLSIASVGVMIERWIYFRKTRIDVQDFFVKFRKGGRKDDLSSLMTICDETPGPLAALLKEGVRRVMERPVKRDDLEMLLTRHARTQVIHMEKYLGVLATIGSVAPFIGLFGTVLGVMRAFRDLALAGSGGAAVVAAGIAEALVATAAGLLVAVPAVAAYNYFIRIVRRSTAELEVGIGEALDVLPTSGREK